LPEAQNSRKAAKKLIFEIAPAFAGKQVCGYLNKRFLIITLSNKHMRKQIAAANWKMNLTLAQGQQLMAELFGAVRNPAAHQYVAVGVPFPYLAMAMEKLAGLPNVWVMAQNCSNHKSGAYTGEVSVEMLHSMGVDAVIIGHSERREYFNETNAQLAQKVNLALENNLIPVFCCGESLAVREAGTQNQWVAAQLQESLFHLSAEQLQQVVIAYEPIWAIGTGKTATAAQAQEIHAFLRSVIAQQYGAAVADSISILYGGSVKAANAAELFQLPDVDGGLVGGASLVAAEFGVIMNSVK
jgi:triosephosphate isomerase (TIM)